MLSLVQACNDKDPKYGRTISAVFYEFLVFVFTAEMLS